MAERWPSANRQCTWTALVIIGLMFQSSVTLHAQRSSQRAGALPNIVLIVADDFGYGDLSCYGATKIHTPHVDKLAERGIRFTDAYVASSLCSPSRYSIMTGRYSWRTKLRREVLKSFAPPLIEEGRTTLASLLASKGYSTACVGKWHLGFNWSLKENAPADAEVSVFDSWGTEPQEYIDFSQPLRGGPVERGFHYFFGIPGSNNMIPFVFIENDRVVNPPSVPNDFGQRTLKAPDWDLRSIDQTLADKAINVIDRHFEENTTDPLFLYFATSAIHAPCLPSATRGQSRAGLRGDMVLEFDRVVGKVTDALKRNGQLDNTIIIITSDNGPQPGDPYPQIQRFKSKSFGPQYDYYQPYFDHYGAIYHGVAGQAGGWVTYEHDPTAGLSGFKSDAWEGGLRVPLIVHWPDKIRKGTVNSQVVSTTDFLATFADIVGAGLNNGEGEDSYSFLQTLLKSDGRTARESLVMVAGRSGALAVRRGSWKYIEAAPVSARNAQSAYPPSPNEFPDMASPYTPQLYNLKEDVKEKNNLLDTNPRKAGELKAIIDKVKENARSEVK